MQDAIDYKPDYETYLHQIDCCGYF
ncbi:unnamed protein product, partial [Rotaria sp. Silwood1]